MTGRIAAQIESALQDSLHPDQLKVINESHLHAGHSGDDGSGESHFQIVIVCSQFAALSRIERHRMVFGILQSRLENLPHALSIKAFAPDQYQP